LSLGSGRDMPLLQDHVVIGRRHDCDLQLQDAAVSSRHCELHFDGCRWWITDLGSRNGTRVNGTAVKHQALRSGDEILIGNQLRFRLNYGLPEQSPAATTQARMTTKRLWVGIAAALVISLTTLVLWWANTT
jgi:pSer/pThr/pTyr-binding forkhead associated (FHA) protein